MEVITAYINAVETVVTVVVAAVTVAPIILAVAFLIVATAIVKLGPQLRWFFKYSVMGILVLFAALGAGLAASAVGTPMAGIIAGVAVLAGLGQAVIKRAKFEITRPMPNTNQE